jgi:quercetin dioxygenase-like cupin family protein
VPDAADKARRNGKSWSGHGTVTIDDVVHSVEPGRMLFIPGNARHQINNVNEEDLTILYAFAISDFSKVQYHF